MTSIQDVKIDRSGVWYYGEEYIIKEIDLDNGKVKLQNEEEVLCISLELFEELLESYFEMPYKVKSYEKDERGRYTDLEFDPLYWESGLRVAIITDNGNSPRYLGTVAGCQPKYLVAKMDDFNSEWRIDIQEVVDGYMYIIKLDESEIL